MSAAYRLDVSARRSRNGRVLSGGQPARVVRLSERGATLLDAALSTGAPATPGSRELLARLVGYALIHPSGEARFPTSGRVTFVVPVKDAAASIGMLVAGLLALGPVIVVDDGSTDGTGVEAERAGACVVANVRAPGPAGARTTGLALVQTELVGFVDSDCLPTRGWLDRLVSLFEDPRLALAAPRVRSVAGPSAIATYEESCSPLDMGPEPALVGPGRRLTYLPSAALLGRTDALRAVGGFDASLRLGEDVDLVWRLVDAGWWVRYAPDSVVGHRPRSSLAALARQRFEYGTSAATLEHRHPGSAAPLHLAYRTAAVWLASLFGWRAATLALAGVTLPAGLAARDPTARWHAVSLAGRGHVLATRHLTRVIAREWLPIALLASVRSPVARRLIAASFALDVGLAYRSGQHGGLASFVGLRLIDNASYAAGVWRGALGLRRPAALLPKRVAL